MGMICWPMENHYRGWTVEWCWNSLEGLGRCGVFFFNIEIIIFLKKNIKKISVAESQKHWLSLSNLLASGQVHLRGPSGRVWHKDKNPSCFLCLFGGGGWDGSSNPGLLFSSFLWVNNSATEKREWKSRSWYHRELKDTLWYVAPSLLITPHRQCPMVGYLDRKIQSPRFSMGISAWGLDEVVAATPQ